MEQPTPSGAHSRKKFLSGVALGGAAAVAGGPAAIAQTPPAKETPAATPADATRAAAREQQHPTGTTVLTVSDHILRSESISSTDRERKVDDMVELALAVVVDQHG